jgi:hypothetical protein
MLITWKYVALVGITIYLENLTFSMSWTSVAVPEPDPQGSVSFLGSGSVPAGV